MKPKSSRPFFRWPDWLDWKILGIFLLLCMFGLAVTWSEPLPQSSRGAARLAKAQVTQPAALTGTPAPQPVRTGTPIPLEWQTNREMSDGIVLGATALVLIIVGGTLNAIRRHR